MEEDVHEYRGDGIAVTYDSNRCIHVRACVEGLGDVFDPDRRPWVDPDGAPADEVAAVVERCPTGALRYERLDGGPAEASPDRNAVTVVADGPIFLHGDVELTTPDGETLLRDTRVALCRCGHSANKPLCDDSHARVFEAPGVHPAAASPGQAAEADAADGGGGADGEGSDEARTDGPADGRLVVTPTGDGPVLLDGPFDLRSGDGPPIRDDEAALCRCGGSSSKPFCDGTHAEIGFSTAPGE